MSKGYIIHKAVELDKVKKKVRPDEQALVTGYLAQPKHDGCNMVAIKYSNHGSDHAPFDHIKFFSRTGEEVKSADHLKEALSAPFFLPGVYLGEYWHPHIDQPTVSGYFRDTKQQHPEPMLVVFDWLTLVEWDNGVSDVPYEDRLRRLPEPVHLIDQNRAPVFLIETQGFLADHDMSTEEAARTFSEGGAYDGLILRNPNSGWRKGDLGTNGEIIKVKPTITLDLRVVGIRKDVGEKTGRSVYVIVVALPDGKEQVVGSGVPFEYDEVPKEGSIVEIEAMSYSKYDLLREPRFKGIRHDKLEAD